MLDTLKNAWKIVDLRKKLLFTLLIIAIFRLGAAIPVPFIDPTALKDMISTGGNLLGYIDVLTGGAFSQSTLFAMGISPYITASIVIQLLTIAIPYLERLSKEGEEGKKRLQKITRYTMIVLAFVQSFAYYVTLRNMRSSAGTSAIQFTSGAEGYFVAAVIIFTFTAGAAFLVWLGELVDQKGVGNGISMILFAGIVSRGPAVVGKMLQYLQLAMKGETMYFFSVPFITLLFIFVIAFIILMTNAERRIPVQYAKRVVGRKMYGGQSTHIPIKVNMSGVMPVIFASSLLAVPGTIRGFMAPDATGFMATFLGWFNFDKPAYAILYFVLIMGFNYFYVAVQYNPIEIANNLKKNSGMIPGIRAGKPTSEFIARVVSKVTFVGGLFLGVIATMPIAIGALTKMNIALGGTTVIIVVGVALDTVRQLESQMMMRHYKGFLE